MGMQIGLIRAESQSTKESHTFLGEKNPTVSPSSFIATPISAKTTSRWCLIDSVLLSFSSQVSFSSEKSTSFNKKVSGLFHKNLFCLEYPQLSNRISETILILVNSNFCGFWFENLTILEKFSNVRWTYNNLCHLHQDQGLIKNINPWVPQIKGLKFEGCKATVQQKFHKIQGYHYRGTQNSTDLRHP